MVALRNFSLLLCLTLIALLLSGTGACAVATEQNSLFSQSTAEALDREFPNPDLSFLLLDVKSGRVLASRWENPDVPIPVGSLVKPFTALAYGEQHGFAYPEHVCRGTATGCWRPRGHGHVNLETAIAYSCNSYFEMLAATLNLHEVSLTATQFGIQSPASSASGPGLIGVGDQWLISPIRLSRAYLELLNRREQPGVRTILSGMAMSARQGTGAAVDHTLLHSKALVKTGTAPCTHAKRAPGDGLVLTLWPADEPRILLLVRVHGVPGAQAAKTAGAILNRIGE